MISNPLKITAVTGAAVLSLGLAGPALAGTGSDPGEATVGVAGIHAEPTLAQVQAWLKAKIDKHIAWIDAAQARIDASTVLTAAQKADWTAKLAAKRAKLVALEAAVAAATTTDGVKAAVEASGLKRALFFGHRFARHHGWSSGRGCDGKSAHDPAGKHSKSAAAVAAIKAARTAKHAPTSTHSVTNPSGHFVSFGGFVSSGHGDGRHGHHFGGGAGRHGGGHGGGEGGHHR